LSLVLSPLLLAGGVDPQSRPGRHEQNPIETTESQEYIQMTKDY
jgi:hypothetical protein